MYYYYKIMGRRVPLKKSALVSYKIKKISYLQRLTMSCCREGQSAYININKLCVGATNSSTGLTLCN